MSSFLFSPLCLDPLQGVLEFTADVKPFHTKVIQAGISLSFTDTMAVGVREQLHSDIEQLFHLHRGNCNIEQTPCVSDGFESEVYDDEVGFEPTIRYTTAEFPIGTQTTGMLNFVGYSAVGNPVFIVLDECTTPPPPCPDGFEMYGYDQALFDDTDPDCINTCNGVYINSCSTPTTPCADRSPTTLASVFVESLLVEDDDGILLEAFGSTQYSTIYGYNPSTQATEIVYTSDNQQVYLG